MLADTTDAKRRWAEANEIEVPEGFRGLPMRFETEQQSARSAEPGERLTQSSLTENTKKVQTQRGVTIRLHKYTDLGQLSNTERDALKLAQAVKMLGVTNVEAHDTLSANGMYDPTTNTVHFALDAENPIAALSHELAHYIEYHAGEKYGAFVAFLQQQANAARRNGWDTLVQEKLEQYADATRSEADMRALAESEAIAEMCEDLLRSETRFREFIQRDRTLGERIVDFFDDILRNLRQLIPTRSARGASTMIRDVEKARDYYWSLLEEAKGQEKDTQSQGETRQSIRNTKNMSWNQQMDAMFGRNGQKPLARSDSVHVGTLGGIYAEFGMDGKDLVLPTRVVMKKGIRTHELTEENIRGLYKGILDPVLVIENNKRNSVLVFTGDSDIHGAPIMVSIDPNATVDFAGAATVETIHGREHFLETLRNIQAPGKAYADKNKLAEMCRTNRIQSSEVTSLLSKFTSVTIPEGTHNVNRNLTENFGESKIRESIRRTFPEREARPALDRAREIMGSTQERYEDGRKIPSGKEVAQLLAGGLHANRSWGLKDVVRNIDAFAGKNTEVRNRLEEMIERPFNEAGGAYARNLKARTTAFVETMKELDIRTEQDSAAVQRWGEGVRQNQYGELVEYTLADLQRECPDNWRNVQRAAEVCRGIYEGYVDELNAMLEQIYPNVIEHAETDAKKRPAGAGRLMSESDLFDLAGCANLFESSSDFLCVFLGDAFLDSLGGVVDDFLGFLEAEAGLLADDLDDLDLLGADVLQDDVELGLLFRCFCGGGGACNCDCGRRCGNAKLLFERLHELSKLENGHRFDISNQLFLIHDEILL